MSSGPHVLPLRLYLLVFGALAVLTGVTTWVAFHDYGFANVVIALTIASVKALLVVLYFMHLRYSSRLLWVFAGAAVVWFLFLIALTLADFDTRVVILPWQG